MNIPHYLTTLPSTKELIKIYNLQTNKKLGQNFLLDDSITDQIVNQLPTLAGKIILEIGPGPGGLTRSILFKQPKKLFAVEYDFKCMPILKSIANEANDVLEIIQADALQFDENTLPGKISIVANLPYNIGTNLVLKWINNIDKFEFIAVMLQREVANRLCASTSNKDYGRLSIIAQCVADIEILMELEPYHFYPPPKVTSSVVILYPKQNRNYLDLDLLGKVTAAAFSLRRKKIKTSLASIMNINSLTDLNIDDNKRAEDVSVLEYINIVKYLSKGK